MRRRTASRAGTCGFLPASSLVFEVVGATAWRRALVLGVAPPPRQNFYGAAGSLAPPPHAAPAYGFQEPPAAPARQWNDPSLRAAQGLETRAPEFVPGAYGGGFAAGGYGGFGLANGAPADEDAYPEGGMGGIIEASLDSLVGGDA